MNTYEFHDIANAFPLLKDTDPDAFTELVEDIKENGLVHEIILYEEKILDGRNRYLASLEAEKEPRFKHLIKGDDPIAYVISANLKRRQLNKSQCEAIAAELANMQLGDNQYNKEGSSNETPSKPRISKAAAAKKMGVSEAQVKRAAKVKKEDPELFEQIKQGKTTTSAAEKKVRDKTTEAQPTPRRRIVTNPQVDYQIILSETAYYKIRQCLNPDTRTKVNEKFVNEAFDLFDNLRKKVIHRNAMSEE